MAQPPPEPFHSRFHPAAVAVTAIGVLADRAAWNISNASFRSVDDLPRHLKMTGMTHAVLFREGVRDWVKSPPDAGLRNQHRWLESEWPMYSFDHHDVLVHRRSRAKVNPEKRYNGLDDTFAIDDSQWVSGKDEIPGLDTLCQAPSPDKATLRIVGINSKSGHMTHARVLSPKGTDSTHWDYMVTVEEVNAQIAQWTALPREETPWLTAIWNALSLVAPPVVTTPEDTSTTTSLAAHVEGSRGPHFDSGAIAPPPSVEDDAASS